MNIQDFSDAADIYAHLGASDRILSVRRVTLQHPDPPLTTVEALLALGRVSKIEDLGSAGPLHAATTADTPTDATDRELRKFEAVFGRDCLRVDQFIGDFFPLLRLSTIATLASGQGVQHDADSEEEPGKIIHEWRDPDDPAAKDLTGRFGWKWPYYGSVDSTPLFIISALKLLHGSPASGDHMIQRRDGRWLALRVYIDDAVTWLCNRLDRDPDGLLTYRRINPRGIENQSWRDSWDSLSHADGSLANRDQPVAAVDVQAIAYDALLAASSHLKRTATGAASALLERANRIQASVIDRFWINSNTDGFFAAALDYSPAGQRQPLRTRTSDVGHLLASRLLDGKDLRAYRDVVVRELFSSGLLCSAGIRSLHCDELRYWAGGYHTGNSWIWQTMHIADGLERHGFHSLAQNLRSRCHRVHTETGLFPEFARGDGARGVLNDRVVDVRLAADKRDNRLEQPPQEVQAWTAASLYANERRAARSANSPRPTTSLESDILQQLLP